MQKKEFESSFLNGLYARRYLILVTLLCAFITVAFKGVRPAPDAKVKFTESVAYGDGYDRAEVVARCEVLEVYDWTDFNRINVYKAIVGENIKDFFVNEGTYLKSGEVYYMYRPPKGSLNNRAIFKDSSWDWGYMAKVFFYSAILEYFALAIVLLVIGSLGAYVYEKNLD